MPILQIILVLVVVGFLLWLIHNLIPMDPVIRKVLDIVIVLLVIFYLLKAFGIWNWMADAKV